MQTTPLEGVTDLKTRRSVGQVLRALAAWWWAGWLLYPTKEVLITESSAVREKDVASDAWDAGVALCPDLCDLPTA